MYLFSVTTYTIVYKKGLIIDYFFLLFRGTCLSLCRVKQFTRNILVYNGLSEVGVLSLRQS